MSVQQSIDHGRYAKVGFLVGLSLFLVGGIGELAVHGFGLGIPGWGEMLLFDSEVIGVTLALLAPLVFGIVLPLVE